MPRPRNQIGPYRVIAFEGDPGTLREWVELVRRPGVDGTGIWRTGRRGREFRLTSKVDAVDPAHARRILRDYTTLIGANPVRLIWDSIDLVAAEGVLVAVLDVQPAGRAGVRGIGAAAGGLLSQPAGYLAADWRLMPIAAP